MLKKRFLGLRQYRLLPPLALTVLSMGGLWHCSNEESPAAYVTLRVLDAAAQPTSADLGVLVAISAKGGSRVRLDVSGGTLEFQATNGKTPLCVETIGNHKEPRSGLIAAIFDLDAIDVTDTTTFTVAVHPNGQEALLSATLGTEGDQARTTSSGGSSANGGASSKGGSTSTGGSATAIATATATASDGINNSCSSLGFQSLHQFATAVVSLGRAAVTTPSSSGASSAGGTSSTAATSSTGGTSEVGGSNGTISLSTQTGGTGGVSSSSSNGGTTANGGTTTVTAGTAGGT